MYVFIDYTVCVYIYIYIYIYIVILFYPIHLIQPGLLQKQQALLTFIIYKHKVILKRFYEEVESAVDFFDQQGPSTTTLMEKVGGP